MSIQTVALPDIHRDTLSDSVPINMMFADPLYSRPVDRSFVAKMAREWHRDAVGVIYLSLRSDGRFAILDGCHRVEACRLAEGNAATLPAKIFIDLTIAQEAALWDRFNRFRKRPRQVDVFRARLGAGDPEATAIMRCCEAAGLPVHLNGRQDGASIVAVTALESSYHRVGDHGLSVVLGILREAFGDDERGYQAPAIDGLSMLWARYGAVVNRTRLVDTLRLAGATRLLSLAHEYRAVHLGMPLAGAWARVVVLRYNRGLRSQSLPEW